MRVPAPPGCRVAAHRLAAKPEATKKATLPAGGKSKADRPQRPVSSDSRSEVDAQVQRKLAELQASFESVVQAEVARRLSDAAKKELEAARAIAANARQLEAVWRTRMLTCKQGVALVMDNWRLLVACLHPDRAPEDRVEQFAKASDVVLRAKELFQKSDYRKWGGGSSE